MILFAYRQLDTAQKAQLQLMMQMSGLDKGGDQAKLCKKAMVEITIKCLVNEVTWIRKWEFIVLAGCLGLFIILVIIGAIGAWFGEIWAGITFILFVVLGIWVNHEKEKKKEQSKQGTDDYISQSSITLKTESISKYQPNKRTKESIQFWYTDFEGNLTHRTVDVKKLDSEYLKAYCHDREDMRTFRVERIDDEIIDLSSGEVLTKIDWLANHGIYEIIKYSNKKFDFDFDNEYDFDEEICFTGFKKADRERLETLATENGFSVKKSVTKSLSYLVYGSNAGSAKLAQAEKVGSCIIDESTFLEIVGDVGEKE